MANTLRTVHRALAGSEEWNERLQLAFELNDVEFNRADALMVTNTLVDGMVFDDETLQVDVSTVEDTTLLEIVEELAQTKSRTAIQQEELSVRTLELEEAHATCEATSLENEQLKQRILELEAQITIHNQERQNGSIVEPMLPIEELSI